MWQLVILDRKTSQIHEAFIPIGSLEEVEYMKREVEKSLNLNKYMTNLVYLGEILLWEKSINILKANII